MKILLFVGIIAISLLNSCNNQKFYEFEHRLETWQIYPTKKGILKSVFTEIDGPPYLQLFSTKGTLLHQILMDYRSFKIINWKDDLITIELVVNSTWPETYDQRKLKIGDNRILFTYRKISTYNALKNVMVDSFSINRQSYSVKLFFKDTLRNEFPISNLSVSSESLNYVKRENEIMFGEEYFFTDKKSITSYLQGILAIYN